MKKQLLLGAFLLGSFLTASAQDNCAGAVAVTSGATNTVTAVTGTYVNGCMGNLNNGAGEWYVFTPAANGYLNVSSAVAGNASGATGVDTRLSIFTGTCEALECYSVGDDVSTVAPVDYRTNITFPVASGTAYYIQWDNAYQANVQFDFVVTFTAADCVSPSDFTVMNATDITTTSAVLEWAAAPGAPASYDVLYGAPGFDPETEGTTVNVDSNNPTLTDLPEAGNFWYYVRSNCGATQSDWIGPFALYLAATPGYTNNFDNADDRYAGFLNGAGWNVTTDEAQNNAPAGTYSDSPTGFIFSNLSTTAVANSWMFVKPMYLEAGQTIDLTFATRLLSQNTTLSATLNVTVGNALDTEGQEIIETFTFQAGATYTDRMVQFTAEEAGTYYFAFNNASAQAAAAATMLVDTFETAEGTVGTEDFASSTLAVFPNPASNVINVTNTEVLNNVQIVDLNGRTVKSVKVNATEAQINVSDLAAGVYMMNIATDKGTTTKKIVKN